MSTPTRRTKWRRVLAVILSIFNAGAGHVALGYPRRGVLWFAASIVSDIACFAAILMNAPTLLWIIVGLLVAIRLSSIALTVRSPLQDLQLGKAKTGLLIVLMIVLMQVAGIGLTSVAQAGWIPSESMYPAIWIGDHFFLSRISLKVGRGDVISFEYPEDRSKTLVKRIVGIGGDSIQMLDGQLILNGVPVPSERTEEPCVINNDRCVIWRETLDGKSYRVVRLFETGGNSTDFGPATIAPGYLFVLGDSRDNSLDSRHFGAISVDLVRGNPLFVYWSSNESGIHWNRINQRIN